MITEEVELLFRVGPILLRMLYTETDEVHIMVALLAKLHQHGIDLVMSHRHI